VGSCPVPSQVQVSDLTGLRCQGVTELAHIRFQISDRECSIKWCHPCTFVHQYPERDCF